MTAGARRRRREPVRVLGLGVAICVTVAVGVALLSDRPEPQGEAAAVVVSPDPTPAPAVTAASPPAPEPEPEPTVVQSGPGTFTTSSRTGSAGDRGTLVRYRVDVEDGLGVSADEFARAVATTLHGERGWTRNGAFRFVLDPDASLRVVLASPDTTDRLCAPLNTRGEVSCRNGDDVVINARRWTFGVPHVPDLQQYRDYVVNHEMGHALGFGHVGCGGKGELAPVMMQQTLGLDGCRPHAWPE